MKHPPKPAGPSQRRQVPRTHPAVVTLQAEDGLDAPIGALTSLLAQAIAADFGDPVLLLQLVDHAQHDDFASTWHASGPPSLSPSTSTSGPHSTTPAMEINVEKVDRLRLPVSGEARVAVLELCRKIEEVAPLYVCLFVDASARDPAFRRALLDGLAAAELEGIVLRCVLLARGGEGAPGPAGWSTLLTQVLPPKTEIDPATQRPDPARSALGQHADAARRLFHRVRSRLGGDAIEPRGEPYPPSRVIPEWCRVRLDLDALARPPAQATAAAALNLARATMPPMSLANLPPVTIRSAPLRGFGSEAPPSPRAPVIAGFSPLPPPIAPAVTAGPSLSRLPADARESFSRWARAVTWRRVGVALGGSGAWGYAHVALMQELHDRGVPIDLVGGSSSGSLMGAYYCVLGRAGLERIVERGTSLTNLAWLSMITSTTIDLVVDDDLGHALLDDLEVILLPVASNLSHGRAEVITHSTVASGVRASTAAPGVFAATITGSGLYVDGAITDNVPVILVERMGADLLIACNPLPPPSSVRVRAPGTPLQDFLAEFNLIDRVRDLWVSFQLMFHDFGDCEDADTRIVYEPPADGYPLLRTFDYGRARELVAHVKGEEAFRRTVEKSVDAWEKLKKARDPMVPS